MFYIFLLFYAESVVYRADSSEILEWFQEIRATLQAIHDLSRCVQYLVTLLDVSHPVSTHDMDIDQGNSVHPLEFA